MTCKLKFICGADLAHQSLAFAFCSSHFSYVHGDLMARMLKWFAISFSSGPVCQNPPPWPVSRLALHGMAHSFIELHKAVIHVIILVSFLWLWFSICLPSDDSMDLTEAEDIKKRWQEYTEELYKKDLNDSDNCDGMIACLEPDILELKSSGP